MLLLSVRSITSTGMPGRSWKLEAARASSGSGMALADQPERSGCDDDFGNRVMVPAVAKDLHLLAASDLRSAVACRSGVSGAAGGKLKQQDRAGLGAASRLEAPAFFCFKFYDNNKGVAGSPWSGHPVNPGFRATDRRTGGCP